MRPLHVKAPHSPTGGKQRAQISSFQTRIKNEHKKKAELEQKIQVALMQKRGSPGKKVAKNSRKASPNLSPNSRRRMYRHPRDMEQSLLQAEEDFADAQGQVESLEAQLSQTRSELVKKTDALKSSELKVETLLSMLNELMTRLANKEVGSLASNDISIDQLWADPVSMQFLDDGNIDDFINEKLERIASSLPVDGNTNSSMGGRDRGKPMDQKIAKENARLFWKDVASSVGNEGSLQYYEFEFAVRKTFLDSEIQTSLLRIVRDMIPEDVIGECAFGEDEFVTCVQHSRNQTLIKWLASYSSPNEA
jgi:hypothetical protein